MLSSMTQQAPNKVRRAKLRSLSCASRTSFTFQTGDMVYTFISCVAVAAVGTVGKRLLFFHGFHS
ncbi:MAG: hypothetical protein QOK48_1631, partial [Blastocatellia bacterium]|nr:hypothetical protein [Blastocatellia bacterium]